jgi:hypothetical protein
VRQGVADGDAAFPYADKAGIHIASDSSIGQVAPFDEAVCDGGGDALRLREAQEKRVAGDGTTGLEVSNADLRVYDEFAPKIDRNLEANLITAGDGLRSALVTTFWARGLTMLVLKWAFGEYRAHYPTSP